MCELSAVKLHEQSIWLTHMIRSLAPPQVDDDDASDLDATPTMRNDALGTATETPWPSPPPPPLMAHSAYAVKCFYQRKDNLILRK